MKRFSRLFSLLVLVALLAAPMLTAYAQDGNPLCEGLTDADCALLTASDEMMAGVTTFSTPSWEISFMLSLPADAEMGAEDAAPAMQEIAFMAKGSGGGFSMDPASEILVHLVIDEASISMDGETESGSAEIIVTQEMAYINIEGEWYGGTLEEADIDVNEILGMTEMANTDTLGMLGIDMTGVMVNTRTDDGDMATFATDVNVGQLIIAALSSPMLGSLLGEEMGGEAMSPEDVQMLGMFLTPMLAGTSLTMDRTIGVNDNYVHDVNLHMVLNLDLSLFAPEIGAIGGEIHFSSGVAGFNEALTASVPESYKPMEELDTGELESLGEGLSGLGM